MCVCKNEVSIKEVDELAKSNSGHLGIFSIMFFWYFLDSEKFRRWMQDNEVHVVKILDLGTLYFHRYSLWMLGFLNGR